MLSERIADLSPLVAAARDTAVFTEATIDRALAEARRADEYQARGGPRRRFEGVTIAWKDVFDVAGSPTRAGTRFLGRDLAERDHPLVTRAAAHGAICVGKTSLSELAVSALGENDAVPAPVNPHDGGRVCGGSSSGAGAAVALGLADIAVGTDCGGSVRLPAAWCGVVGFKPTWQPIPHRGLVPFSPSLDCVGVIASTVAQAANAADVLVPPRTVTPASPRPVRLRHVPLPGDLDLDHAVARVYGAALATLTQAGLPTREVDCHPLTRAAELRRRHGSTAADEGVALWRQTVLDAGDAASPRLRRWFAAHTPSGLNGERQRARRDVVAAFNRAIPPGVVLVIPSSPIEPPPLSSLSDDWVYAERYARANALLWPFNELNAPAISLPCGRTDAGLPVGLQLVAPTGRDHDVFTAAAAVEAALTNDTMPSPLERSGR